MSGKRAVVEGLVGVYEGRGGSRASLNNLTRPE